MPPRGGKSPTKKRKTGKKKEKRRKRKKPVSRPCVPSGGVKSSASQRPLLMSGASLLQPTTMDGRTIPGKINHSGGGVARNISEALSKLDVRLRLVSAVGDDHFGSLLRDSVPGMGTRGILRANGSRTGACVVLCDKSGECLAVVGDMDIHGEISLDHIRKHEGDIAGSSLVILDGNLSQETTEFVLQLSQQHSVPVWFEPTDIFRASKPFINKNVTFPTFISPNLLEFRKIYETIFPNECNGRNFSDEIEECVEKGHAMAELVKNIIITLGKKGVMVIRRGLATDPFFTAVGKPRVVEKEGAVSHRLYTPRLISNEEIVNVSGAGDCFASGFISAMLKGESEESCIKFGFRCSTASLRCSKTVPEEF